MSLFTLENINKINIGDGSGVCVGVCGIAGGVSVGGFINATEGVSAGTLRLASGSITDTTGGVISFGNTILSNTGGVSFSGGVSINAFTFPSALPPVAGQIFQTDVNGLISLTTNGGGGGGTSVSASSGISVVGTSVSVNVGAGLNFGTSSGGTSTVQLNLYSSGNLQFYPGAGSVGSSVGLCSAIIVPTSVTVGLAPLEFVGDDDSVVITGGNATGGAIQLYDASGTANATINLEADNASRQGVITLSDGTGPAITLIGADGTGAGTPGNVIRMGDTNTFGDSIKLMSHGGTHDQSEIDLYDSGGTSTVKIHGDTADSNGFANGAGLIELFGSGGNTPGTPTVTLGGTSGRLTLNDGTTSNTVTIGLSSSATENTNFILPGVSPAADGYVLSSDTVGNLSWVANGSGGGGATDIDSLSDATATANTIALGNTISSPRINTTQVGLCAGYNLSGGTDGVLIGFEAGQNLAQASQSIIIGSGTGNNTGIFANTIAIGHGAMDGITGNATSNVAIGTGSLGTATGITQTVAIGHGTGSAHSGNITPQGVYVGFHAGISLTSGEKNTLVGHTAGDAIDTGEKNTIVGNNGGAALASGDRNVIIGAETAGSLTTGSNNIVIGHNASVVAGPNTSNNIYLGDSNITGLYFAATIFNTSDERDKTDIEDSSFGLDFIQNLRPVEYTWDRRVLNSGDKNCSMNGKRRIGLIAQEVLETMPDNENEILDLVKEENPERYHVGYPNLIPVLVKAVKDLKAEVDTLKQRMDACSC